MSDSDNFIDEVSDAVRRERLFGYIRRYGWIAIVLVLLLVGGAAYNEWSKASSRAAAQAQGDAILTALDAPDADARLSALEGVDATGGAQAIVQMLAAAEAMAAEDPAAAADALRAIEADSGLSNVYRQMATLKRVLLTASDTAPEDRIADLQPLLAAGAPFRVLAEEQVALAELEAGDRDAALNRLRALTQDTEASSALRQRATQLIMALGGAPEAA